MALPKPLRQHDRNTQHELIPISSTTFTRILPINRISDNTKYPSTLLFTGDGDTRVAPLHARKMAARLQAANRGDANRPILLLYDTKSGHSGGRPLNKIIEEYTDILSFLFWQLDTPQNSVANN